MEIVIKHFNELNTKELYGILKLRSEVFVVEQRCIYQDIDGHDTDGFHLILKVENQIVGCLRILKKGVTFNQVSIGRVCVKESHRGQKIAQRMMKRAIRFIQSEIMEEEIKISAQTYLIKFYERLGFNEVSDKYLEDGIPHIDMIYRGEL